MSKELSYLDTEGYTVFTSEFHRKRGRCCQSSCLHCPYGTTIKKFGLEFRKITSDDDKLLAQIFKTDDFISRIKDFLPDNVLIMTIKGVVCGVVLRNHIIIKEMVLKDEFSAQGISKELAEAYLF
jgi:hypothetical protein